LTAIGIAMLLIILVLAFAYFAWQFVALTREVWFLAPRFLIVAGATFAWCGIALVLVLAGKP